MTQRKHVSGSIASSFMQFVFIVCQVEEYQNILKLCCRPLAFTSCKSFLKNKIRSWASLPASFSVLYVIFYYLAKFYCLVAFTSWDIGQYVYCNYLLIRMWRHKFWDYFVLSTQAVFSKWQKSKDKNLNILRTKRAFKMN